MRVKRNTKKEKDGSRFIKIVLIRIRCKCYFFKFLFHKFNIPKIGFCMDRCYKIFNLPILYTINIRELFESNSALCTLFRIIHKYERINRMK